jgi:type I restriction enzyme M protein
MALALNKPKLDNLAGEIWKSAERLRGKFKAYEYQNVSGELRKQISVA